MLKIQVLGQGLIPRGLGLAPRKEPFYADYRAIADILNASRLTVYYFNPDTGKFTKLTKETLKSAWDKYSEKEFDQAVEEANKETPIEDGGENHGIGEDPGNPGKVDPGYQPPVQYYKYGKYHMDTWNNMYDADTRTKWLYHDNLKLAPGDKIVNWANFGNDRLYLQVYICTKGHATLQSMDPKNWRVAANEEEERLEWVEPRNLPETLKNMNKKKYDQYKDDYKKDDEVLLFDKVTGGWTAYKATQDNPPRRALMNEPIVGWTKLYSFEHDGTPIK